MAATQERFAHLWQQCVQWAAEHSAAEPNAVQPSAVQPTASHFALVTVDYVELHLNEIFSRGPDECTVAELFDEMGLPLVPQLYDAVAEVLTTMEDLNKVLFREDRIHLI